MVERLRELWAYRDLVGSLVSRDLKARYKNSVLGVAWSWLNPLLMMLVFTLVFAFLAGRPDVPHFHIFVLCALLPWNFFAASVSGATSSIVGNAHLVKKIYFPREVLPLSVVLAALVNMIVALPVLFLLALLSGAPVTPWSLLLPLPILVQLLFTLGVALFLSTLDVFFRDTQVIMEVFLLAWFFVTPIFYPLTEVPQTARLFGITLNPQRVLKWLNPMASIIDAYRDLLYRGVPVRLDSLLRAVVAGLVMLIVGYLVFLRYSPRFGEEV